MFEDAVLKVLRFFFVDNFPSLLLILRLFPFAMLYVILALQAGVFFRRRFQWKVGYTRKVFHFLIFGAAGWLQAKSGTPSVFILGWAVSLCLVIILLRGEKSAWFSVLARPSDAPYEKRYILYPYLATFAGGVLANMYFEPSAVVAGFLVAGFGDAIGEPVGTRWGKHRYRVPSYGSNLISYRSWEGSSAVFVACIAALALTSVLTGVAVSIPMIIGVSLCCAVVEGISPHGWDNFTSQIAAATLTQYILL